MRNLKLLLLTLSFVFFGNIYSSHASELVRMCTFKNPSLTFSLTCDPAEGIVFFGGENCSNEIRMTIYFANLGPGYDVPPAYPGPFFLPSGLSDLRVHLDSNFDGNYDTFIPVTDFYFKGLKLVGNDGGGHYIYEHDINLSDYLIPFDPCTGNIPPVYTGDIQVRLVEDDPNTNDPVLVDLSPYAGLYDIASCEVFHETCQGCTNRNGQPINPGCTNVPPIYNMPICPDCTTECIPGWGSFNSTEDNILEQESTSKKSATPIVTPNPFEDEFVIHFESQTKAPVQIEVIDITGKSILVSEYPEQIGNRQETLQLQGYPSGIYFCRIIIGDWSHTTKIIKL